MSTAVEPTQKRRPKRFFMWFFLLSQVFFGWMLYVGIRAGTEDSCAGLTGDRLANCEAGTAVGVGLGIGFILLIWFSWNAFLLVAYAIFKLSRRP